MDFEVTNALTQQNPEQIDEEFTTMAYPSVQENLKLPTEDQVRLEEPASSAGTLSSLQNLNKELSFTNQFLMDKSQEDEPDKYNTKAEVQSMVTVPIHQDTSSVPLMTTPVIDLTMSQPVSTMVQAPLPTSTATVTTITTITSLPPPLPQPQQSTADPILVRRIGELEQHMVDLLQDNLYLGERLDKHGTWVYNLEKLDIPHKVSQAIDEIVTDAVDWAMQAPLRARFRGLPTVDMKEILQQRMFEDDSYKTNNVHKDLYEALQKSLELDYSNQRLADQEEARASGAPGTSRASGSSQFPPPPPPLSTASAQQSMAWTISDTRYESAGIVGAQELSPSDDLMHDDSVPDKQGQVSDDQDYGDDHTPAAADSRKDWWNPLPKEERPATPEPAWTILPSNVSNVENNWVFVLASSNEPPAENSLLAKTGDMTTFLNWYCRQINKSKLTQADLEGQAYEVVKVFYPDIIHFQFQMEECYKMLTDQVNWANPEGDQVRINVNRPLPLGGPPGHVTIQTEFFFNKYLEYLRFGNKGSMPVLSIYKMKADRYPGFGLELLVPVQIWIKDKFYIDKHDSPSHRKEVRTHMRILSVVRIKAYSRYSDFEDLNLLLLQGYLDHLSGSDKQMLSTATQLNLTKPGWDATVYDFKHDYTIIESPRAVIFPVKNNERKIMQFNEIYKFSDGTLTRILETLDYRVKEFNIKRLNPGMNTHFWTEKDVTRSKEFITAIERRLKKRRIYRNLECFVGGRVRDIDYMLL
ncbi:hypothetical protein Tco_0893966 [Tanacetum coccineum]|uniref:Uncharacterized protein n=1 Tax=Tanacetum coccineum TaxID=301880 RepID=A0ABQ5CFU0_9ASTR